MERAAQLHEQLDLYRRQYNDTATWLAETLDGSMFTPFEYIYDGHELYADDGSALSNIFHYALTDATRLVIERPELAFELRRRQLELDEYGDMLKMVNGELPNTMVVVSDFPKELMSSPYDVGGYNVTRKQSMLRILTWNGQRLNMYSQSLDGSNRHGLEAIYRQFGLSPNVGELLGQRIYCHHELEEHQYVTTRLTGVYDRSLRQQYGGDWYAGRQEPPRDTYKFVLSQHALVDNFVIRFMQADPSDEDRYNLAALMEKRFNALNGPNLSANEMEIIFSQIDPRTVEWQLQQAGDQARSEGKIYSGCGVSVGTSLSAQDQLQIAGYGNVVDEDKYGSRTFTCPKGHTNYRPHNKLLGSCHMCGVDVSCKKPESSMFRKTGSGSKRFGLEKSSERYSRSNKLVFLLGNRAMNNSYSF